MQKRWSDPADIWAEHPLIEVIRDDAGENKCKEIVDFFNPMGSKPITPLHMSNGRMVWQSPRSTP